MNDEVVPPPAAGVQSLVTPPSRQRILPKVLLYQTSPSDTVDGSPAIAPTFMPALLEFGEKVCLTPAVYVDACVLSTRSLPALMTGLPLVPSPLVTPILPVVP